VRKFVDRLTLIAVLLCQAAYAPELCRAQVSMGLDTSTYTDSATAVLVELARARHRIQTQNLAGYRAKVFTRLEGRVGASRFGPEWNVFKYETAARMHWAAGGSMRVDIDGGRMTGTRMPGFGRDQMASFFEDIFGGDVWFIPSTVGDAIAIMGLPDAEAMHPLAREAAQFYQYELVDSTRIAHPHRAVRVFSVNVEPRVNSAYVEYESIRGEQLVRRRDTRSLFSSRMWIDADSLDVVRLTGAFVGDEIWDEEDDAPQLKNLEADIEYSLHEDRYWLPHRQVLSAHWTFKYLPGADLVGTGITTFSDHEVDERESHIAFAHEEPGFDVVDRMNRYRDGNQYSYRSGNWRCPDAWEFDESATDPRCGTLSTTSVGRNRDGSMWEVNLPTLDSLRSYDFGEEWEETVQLAGREFLDNAVREMAKTRTSPPVVDGGLDWKQVYNTVGYNRVQGVSAGGGYKFNLWPAYTTLYLNARYGFGDKHLLGSGMWRRDAPVGRFEMTAYRSVRDVEPWTNGTGVGNSLKALVLGHDDADYYLASFAFGIGFSGYTGWFADGVALVEIERQKSLPATSSSFIAGDFQANPAIVNGDYVRGTVSKTWRPGFSRTTALTLSTQTLASKDSVSARFWGSALLPYATNKVVASMRTRVGVVVGSQVPQMYFRIGGPSTVRGYGYGSDVGRSFWSIQGDLEWVVSQWWSPVFFADMGGIDFSDTPLVGAGLGLSLLSGWARVDLSRGMTHGAGFRLDVTLGIPTG